MKCQIFLEFLYFVDYVLYVLVHGKNYWSITIAERKAEEIYQIIVAEGTASFKKLGISCSACFDNPVQVFEQTGENFT